MGTSRRNLDNAIKCNLPVERSTAKERITKGAAIAMLGKVYATQHKYPEAKQLLGTLLKAPYSYELMDNFEKNFTNEEEFNKESVFELAYSPDGDYSWSNESGICLGCYIPQFIGPVKSGGWAKLMPNSLIVGEFTKETRPSDADTKFDKRLYASLFLMLPTMEIKFLTRNGMEIITPWMIFGKAMKEKWQAEHQVSTSMGQQVSS